jgi:hypothetical protein
VVSGAARAKEDRGERATRLRLVAGPQGGVLSRSVLYQLWPLAQLRSVAPSQPCGPTMRCEKRCFTSAGPGLDVISPLVPRCRWPLNSAPPVPPLQLILQVLGLRRQPLPGDRAWPWQGATRLTVRLPMTAKQRMLTAISANLKSYERCPGPSCTADSASCYPS